MNFSEKTIRKAQSLVRAIEAHCEQYEDDEWFRFQMTNRLSDKAIEELRDRRDVV